MTIIVLHTRTGDSPGNSKGFWGKLFSSNSITGNSNK
jgi:hypothetical protein